MLREKKHGLQSIVVCRLAIGRPTCIPISAIGAEGIILQSQSVEKQQTNSLHGNLHTLRKMKTTIQTADSVKDQFLAELRALLAKYDANGRLAQLTAEDHWSGYSECGEDVRMTVSIPSIWDVSGNQLRECVDIDLGKHFDRESK